MADNLVLNGDFEQNVGSQPVNLVPTGSSNLTGWTVVNGSVDDVKATGGWKPASGTRSIDLSGDNAGTIRQILGTTQGSKYLLKFSLAGNPGGTPGTRTMKVTIGGATQIYTFDTTGKTVSDMGWQEKTLPFTAADNSTTLEFASQDNTPFGVALDSISVNEVAKDADYSDYSIQDAYADKGVYELRTVPQYGKLTKGGVLMKVGDRFTQKDINTGAIQYDVGVMTSTQSKLPDNFKFVTISGGQPITASAPKRSTCMPVPTIAIPADGVYTFPITILVTPPPAQVTALPLILYEMDTQTIGKSRLEWANDRSSASQEVFTVTAVPKYGVLTMNGAPVAVGTKFTQEDINNNGLVFKANENESGSTTLAFTVCNQVDKCTNGVYLIQVKLFPSPQIVKSNITINECATDVVLTKDNLFASVAGGTDFPNATNEVNYAFEGCAPTYTVIPGKPAVPGTPAVPDRLAASVLKVRISGSILNNIMPKWRVEVDGNQVGEAEYVTTARRDREEFEIVTIQGSFGSNPNQVVIVYLNNDGATPDDVATDYEHDRNLYVDYIDLNDKVVTGASVTLESPGSWPNAPKYGGIYTNRSVPFVTGGAPPKTIGGTPAVPEIPAVPEQRIPSGSALTIGRITISPCAFTQQDLLDGKVKITDNCRGEPSTDCVNLPFGAQWKNKTTPGKFRVCFVPKPVITVPLPPDLTVVDSCMYQTTPGDATSTANGFFPGVASLVADCGEFVVFRGRDVPPEIPPGTIIYLPDAGPKTVIKLPDGQLATYPMTKTEPPAPGESPVVDTGAATVPNKFTSSDDGTKYIRDNKGQIVPIAGTAPNGGATPPNIDGFAQKVPHVTDVNSLAEAPATATKVMTPSGYTFVPEKVMGFEAWSVEGDIDYGAFFWAGPNEFYVAPGKSFNIYIYGNRGFVKITPGGSLDGEHFVKDSTGNLSQFYQAQQGLTWNNNGFLGIKSTQDGGGAWGGEAVSSTFFVMQGAIPVYFNRTYLNLDNYVTVGTNPGGAAYGGRPNHYADPYYYGRNAYPSELDKSKVNAVGNIPYYVWWHLNGSRARLNGGAVGTEAKAYLHAVLAPTSRVRTPAAGAAAIDMTLPGAGTTWEFPMTALDLITGQQISRTYKVHWTASGRSPAGRSAETTDMMGLPGSGPGAAPGSLHCKVNYGGGRPESNCAKK